MSETEIGIPKPVQENELGHPPPACEWVSYPWMLLGTLHETWGVKVELEAEDLHKRVVLHFGPADAEWFRMVADGLDKVNGIVRE